MLTIQSRAISLSVGLICYISVNAQQWANPHYDAHCLDFRELGYPTQNLIPADNSCITALMTHTNGFIYGATSGVDQSYLFFYNRYINKVRPLGRIGAEVGVYHGLLEGANGEIYIGTGLNVLSEIELTTDFNVEYEAIVKQLWKDIKEPYNTYQGGHIYRYYPQNGDLKRYTNDDFAQLEDLGIPIPGNSIYAMIMDPGKSMIYGITYPDAHFFIFDLTTKSTKDLGESLTSKVFSGPERTWRTIPRALYCDPVSGIVYTSGDNGFIIKYVPGTEKLELTWMRLPGEYWEGLKSIDYPVIENFCEDPVSGRLLASTNDGYLIELKLKEEEVIVLGKPRVMRRMRAMAVGLDNKIYMITGEPERSCKLHTYDLSGSEGFRELGIFAVDHSPYYAKRAYQFDAITIGPDGTVFCGESDRRGALFLYFPLSNKFRGVLNPFNPVMQRQRIGTPGLIQENL